MRPRPIRLPLDQFLTFPKTLPRDFPPSITLHHPLPKERTLAIRIMRHLVPRQTERSQGPANHRHHLCYVLRHMGAAHCLRYSELHGINVKDYVTAVKLIMMASTWWNTFLYIGTDKKVRNHVFHCLMKLVRCKDKNSN